MGVSSVSAVKETLLAFGNGICCSMLTPLKVLSGESLETAGELATAWEEDNELLRADFRPVGISLVVEGGRIGGDDFKCLRLSGGDDEILLFKASTLLFSFLTSSSCCRFDSSAILSFSLLSSSLCSRLAPSAAAFSRAKRCDSAFSLAILVS